MTDDDQGNESEVRFLQWYLMSSRSSDRYVKKINLYVLYDLQRTLPTLTYD